MTVTIRLATPADAPAIAQVRVDAWRTTYRGMIPDAYLDGDEGRGQHGAVGASVLVRRARTRPTRSSPRSTAGSSASRRASCSPSRSTASTAELTGIYLVRERAARGHRHAASSPPSPRRSARTAPTGLIVWVIAGNKAARAFYERSAPSSSVEQPFTWDGMDLVEAGYGWRDLPALIAAGGAAAVLH